MPDVIKQAVLQAKVKELLQASGQPR